MKAFLLTALAALTCFFAPVNAQQSPPCGFDILHKKMMQDPEYARAMERNEAKIREYVRTHLDPNSAQRLNAPLYTIPVVVHVVHTGGAIGTIYNPSDAQIIGAINYLNQVYDGTLPGTEGVGDIQIQFALAQRDPNCNPTTGIDRVNGSSLTGYTANGMNLSTGLGANEIAVKNQSRWNVADYYNIWVVNKIDGVDGTSGQFVAGFAYFPPPGANSLVDGTVMLATQMIAGQKTLPHEIGHALNLYHPFEGSPNAAVCQPNADCNIDGDEVCDTDPISYNQTGGIVDFTCRTGANTVCGGTFSINTEKNYMNYTSCFTLFTAGQRTRMQGAMLLSTRANLASSLGATPTYTGSTQCPPKINFELGDDAKTEATTSTTGCRSYRDYTYNMTIGNDPTQAATATIGIGGGTATEGVDFDITTNGNFASPSKVVNFPAAAHNTQTFTVRIYDDASVESAETFILNFSVNAGGGNAVIGNADPTITISINDNDVNPVVPGTISNHTIGANTFTATLQSVFRSDKLKHRAQVLYRASELTAAGMTAGNITAIMLRVITKNSTKPYAGFTVSMAHTATTAFSNFIAASYTQVYQGNFTSAVGDNTLAFGTGGGSSSSFAWDGTSNIVIQFCFDNSATSADPAEDQMESTVNPLGAGVFVSCYSNYTTGITAGCSLGASQLNTVRVTARFSMSLAGNPIATTAVTSRTEYLGPNADVYFYDNTGRTMARITNLTSFDYGCTQISIDRTGSTSSQFWNNNTSNYLASKSFRVIPTNNTGSGNYVIYLYYTQGEINGWQTATGQSIASARVVKISNGNFIPDVTPSTPHLPDVMNVAASNAAFGTDYAISGNFSSTGFSGFGIGLPGSAITLPVTWLSFEGNKEKETVVLTWKTADEYNNDHFDIETSKNGTDFYKIGAIASNGNAVIEQLYRFTDSIPLPGLNYYRLAQVDIDGRKTYSKTISITVDEPANMVRLYPNPGKDKVYINFAKPVNAATMQILSIDGKLIKQVHRGYMYRNEPLNINELHSGTYLLRINTGTNIYKLKFVKQ